MIRPLRICDSDEFIDILTDAFTRELHHIGSQYGYNKKEFKLMYMGSRLLQCIYGDLRDVPHIAAYYDEQGSVLGISKIVPVNARKDQWFSEMTAVRENLQQRGIGTALKEYIVHTYGKTARRLFAHVREENIPMINVNQRVGYHPYIRKILFTRDPDIEQKKGKKENIEGLRPFKNDQKAVYNLYIKRTPLIVRKIEEMTPEDFTWGTVMKLQALLRGLTGGEEKKYVLADTGRVYAYIWIEPLWAHYENLHILMDPQAGEHASRIAGAIAQLAPRSHLISYVPDFCDAERTLLSEAGFTEKDVYIGMAWTAHD